MIKNNKVINSILLPKVLFLGALIAFTSGASICLVQQKKTTTTGHIAKQDACLMGLVALLIIFSFMDIYSDYKKDDAFLKLVARKYLKTELKNYPELKIFEKVLDNPQAMQNVSAMVFNSLRPSERKYVAQIITEMRKNLKNHKKYDLDTANFSKDTKILISSARNQIIPIIQGHASAHPEFVSDIYSAMACADMIYIMSKNSIEQHTK